ncbi:pentapeptide repeat-containing protein [Celeribacter neptunius]|uniref:Uncharacterized protein YjbI, contains pentapeptide repeats n=1 Tax=Celeribacter neptunius TaxID=588602 RepID=A0A1I3JSM4_9RHOB|nr:pentapeptide repeat-containing protein [Celeribacter neptunius]SFI63184.1 Uncharacterized protein YjbI, contains pentapeptide repeats [Celeribacter neptunius]
MTEFASRLSAFLSQPLVPWLILGVIITGVLLGQVGKLAPDDPIDRMKRLFGVGNVPHGFAFLIAALWCALVAVLVTGLFILIYEIVWGITLEEARKEESDFRFLLAKTTALTAVLGALVALPFTALRLKLTTEQNRHSEDVLYNDKLHNALYDLHSRRQLSDGKWEDDIIRRNGAIDRLEALAVERPLMAPRIARMLCVYLKEMSREFQAEEAPEDLGKTEDWAQGLIVKRSDMENAAQVLGRMHDKTGVAPKELAIDLSGTNLQAMRLEGLNFDRAMLTSAKMDGAKLNGAKLNWAQLNWAQLNWAQLNRVQLNWAQLIHADLGMAELNEAELNEADLNEANLGMAELNRTELNGARLKLAWLNHAMLLGAELNAQTDLRTVYAWATALRSVDLSMVRDLENLISESFGDASVTLPDAIKPLVADRWPDRILNIDIYFEEWNLFKEDPSSYVPPQHRAASD